MVVGGKEAVVQAIGMLEERCNNAKEEVMEIGTVQGGKVRMLGSYADRRFDLEQRLKRMRRAWWAVKNRLRGSRLTKRTQARVVEACVESSGLFDAQVRPWRKTELKKLQSEVDRAYRFVWRTGEVESR